MKTYQDLLEVKGTEQLGKFVLGAIEEHKSSELYRTAIDAYEYEAWRNPTIKKYQKLLYTLTGQAVPDNYSANHKCGGNFYDRFTTQEVQYLLGNGVTFNNNTTKKKLGKNFDNVIQKLARHARVGAVSFGFYNLDHFDAFDVTEFAPLWDEEDGKLKAGIRFWQLTTDKPLRATLYTLEGYTDIVYKDGKANVGDIKPYVTIVTRTPAGDMEIAPGEAYETFPIIPMWGSEKKQSSIVGLRENIDCYDLIKSGFANDLDDASMIYWTIQNAGGMDDVDMAKFIERMKTVRAAAVSEEARAEAHTMEVPYQSRETYLTRLERDMYRDAMAVDTERLSAGNVVATAIRAAYQSLEDKCDGIEYCVTEFIDCVLEILGIDDAPTYKRNRIANMSEETQMVLSAAQYLDDRTVLNHLPFISPDEVEAILDNLTDEEARRYDALEKENEQLRATVNASAAETGANGGEGEETGDEE